MMLAILSAMGSKRAGSRVFKFSCFTPSEDRESTLAGIEAKCMKADTCIRSTAS